MACVVPTMYRVVEGKTDGCRKQRPTASRAVVFLGCQDESRGGGDDRPLPSETSAHGPGIRKSTEGCLLNAA